MKLLNAIKKVEIDYTELEDIKACLEERLETLELQEPDNDFFHEKWEEKYDEFYDIYSDFEELYDEFVTVVNELNKNIEEIADRLDIYQGEFGGLKRLDV